MLLSGSTIVVAPLSLIFRANISCAQSTSLFSSFKFAEIFTPKDRQVVVIQSLPNRPVSLLRLPFPPLTCQWRPRQEEAHSEPKCARLALTLGPPISLTSEYVVRVCG